MAKSSIHIKAGSAGNTLHNARENFSHSVVFTDEKNELLNSSRQAFEIYRRELSKRAKAYTNRTKQKLQARAITHQSAVVNLLQHHTLKDLKPIKEYIEKTFDTKVFQIAIHRDEGKLVSKEDGTELYSGQDFFRNPKDNKLYYDKDFSKEIDLSKYTIEKNYHAHIEFLGLDTTGAGIKRNYFTKRKLSELQDFVAQSLSMERGVNRYAKKVKSEKRFDPGTDKRISSQIQENKRELKLTVTKLKNEIENYRKELAAKNKELKLYKQSDYADISALKKALKKSNIEEIYQEFLELKKENEKREEELKKVLAEKEELREKLEEQKQLNDELEQEKNAKYNQVKIFNKIFTKIAQEFDVETKSYGQIRDDVISKYISAKQQVAELQKTIDTQNATISSLRKEKSELEQEIKFAEHRESEMQSFRFNYYSSSRRSHELLKKLRDAEGMIETLEKEKSDLEKQVQETQKAERSYNFVNSKNDELQEQLRDAEETIGKLEKENSDLKAKYKELRDAFMEITQALSIKFVTVKQVVADIISRLKSAKQTETAKEPEPEIEPEIERKYQQMVERAYKEQQQNQNKYPKLK